MKWNYKSVYDRRAKRVSRYAVRKEPDVFDRAVLTKLVKNLDKEFRLQIIDERIFNECREYDWSRCADGAWQLPAEQD